MAFVDDTVVIIGDVSIEKGAMIFPGVLIRADDDYVLVSEGSAILDRAFMEAPAGNPVIIGKGSIVSHGAIIHGAKIGNNTLVGIGATVLDGAVIGNNCTVAAGSLIPPGKVIDDDSVVMGIPAKKVRNANKDDAKRLAKELKILTGKSRIYMGDFKSKDIRNLPKLKKKRKTPFMEIDFRDE